MWGQMSRIRLVVPVYLCHYANDTFTLSNMLDHHSRNTLGQLPQLNIRSLL